MLAMVHARGVFCSGPTGLRLTAAQTFAARVCAAGPAG